MTEHSFTNKLINEKSPYLLQHAHNPVNWYPWGQEAFEKAKGEDKLLLVSIGYATCHWCHVMERGLLFHDVLSGNKVLPGALLNVFIWAIPILGFIGTVFGIALQADAVHHSG